MNQKTIIVQAAFERTLQNEEIILVNENKEVKTILLNGNYYVAEGYGTGGGIYMVYYNIDDLNTPFLVLDIHKGKDVTQEVKIQTQKTIASLYAAVTFGENEIPIFKEETIKTGN